MRVIKEDIGQGDTREPRFKVGQRVTHPSFGEGTVTGNRIDGEDEAVRVKFDKFGTKLMATSDPTLIPLDK